MMNKNEFINKLDSSLKGISYEDRKEIIFDYEEHFSIGIQQGKTEEEIAAALGDPILLAKQFRKEYFIEKAEKNKSAGNIMKAVFASVGLGFLNLLLMPIFIAVAAVLFSLLVAWGSVVISLVAAAACLVISFLAASVGMAFGGIGLIIGVFIEPYFPQFINIDVNTGSAIFLSLGVICFGILAFIGSMKLLNIFIKGAKKCIPASYNGAVKCVKGFYMWMLNYLKMNKNFITRKKENEDAE